MFSFKLYIWVTCSWNFNTSHLTFHYSYSKCQVYLIMLYLIMTNHSVLLCIFHIFLTYTALYPVLQCQPYRTQNSEIIYSAIRNTTNFYIELLPNIMGQGDPIKTKKCHWHRGHPDEISICTFLCKVKLGVRDINFCAKYKHIIDIMKHLRWEVLISHPNHVCILLKKKIKFNWDGHTKITIFLLCLRVARYYHIRINVQKEVREWPTINIHYTV